MLSGVRRVYKNTPTRAYGKRLSVADDSSDSACCMVASVGSYSRPLSPTQELLSYRFACDLIPVGHIKTSIFILVS